MPMNVRFSCALLAISVAVPLGLHGQAPSEVADSLPPSAYELQGVLIQVTRARQELSRFPQSVSVVGEQAIQTAQRQVTIDEALRIVPGVFATNRHNYTLGEGVRLSVRAPQARIGTRGLQLLQDGIPLTTADGTTLPNNLDLGSAGRIEVIRGPSSVFYGNSAGGVVSVETQFPSTRPLVLHPEVQFGSNDYRRQQIKAEGTAGPMGYVLNLNRMETSGFRDYGKAEIRRMNLVTRTLLSERTLLRGILNLYDMPWAENPSSLTREDALDNPTSVRSVALTQGWGKSVTQGQGGLHLEHDLGGGHVVRTLGWALQRDNWNPIPGQIIALERAAAGFRSDYQGASAVGGLRIDWTTGIDLSRQKDDRNEFANLGVATPGQRAREGSLQIDQTEEVLSVGPFAQATFGFGESVGVTAGVRYDRYSFTATDRFLSNGDQSGDRSLSAVSPMLGFTYTVAPALNLYGNVATAYQTPTTVELSNRPDGLGGFNAELEPEYLRSFELGLRGGLPQVRIRYDLAAYLSTIDDALLRYEGPGGRAFFRNTGRNSRDGVELALEWDPIEALQTRLAYTYQDFRFVRYELAGVDYSGNTEPGAPPHMLFAGVTAAGPLGLTSAVDFRWFDAYPVNDANTASNWSHTLVDLRFGLNQGWRAGSIRPFVGIDNLLDERYNASAMINAVASRFYEPAPGRTVYFGLGVGAGL